MQRWGREESSVNLGMPYDTHDSLIRYHGDVTKRSAIINEYLSHRPYPTWAQIVELYTGGEGEEGEGKNWTGSGCQRQVHD